MKRNAHSKISKSWYLPNVIKKIDMFGQPVPTFNLKGEKAISTIVGGICTFLIICVSLAYGSLKFVHLMEKRNPQIIQVTEKNFFGSDHIINLDEIGFKFAFTIENYLAREVKDDPAFVKYIIRYHFS